MKIKIIFINILYYFFNNNIIYGSLCKKKCCKDDNNKVIQDEVNEENKNNQKNEDNKENEDKKKKDDILKKKREELLEKYKKLKSKNDELPEDKRIDIVYDEEDINFITIEESLKTISDTFDKKEKDILAIWKRINKKKYEEELKKTLEDRKKECNDLLEEVNNLIKDNFTKYFKKIDIKIDIDKKDIEDKDNVDELDNIIKDLKNKKDEIDKLIEEDNKKDKYVCETKEEFIQKFNERKNILADRFNDPVKNNLKSHNLDSDNIGDYFTMYSEMTNDVFNHEISLDLQIYRYILKLEGFTTALDYVLNEKIKLYITNNYDEYGDCCNGELYGLIFNSKYYFPSSRIYLDCFFKTEREDYDGDNWNNLVG